MSSKYMVGVKRVEGHRTQSRGDIANVETEQAKQRRLSVIPVIAIAMGNIIVFMPSVTGCGMCACMVRSHVFRDGFPPQV